MHFAEAGQIDAAANELQAGVIGFSSAQQTHFASAGDLLVRYGLADAALSGLAAMARDPGEQPEAHRRQGEGLGIMIDGLKRLAAQERDLLSRACILFDALYAGLRIRKTEPAR